MREANAVLLPRTGWPRARGCGQGEGRVPLWPLVEAEAAERGPRARPWGAEVEVGRSAAGPRWGGRGLRALPARSRPCLSGPHPPPGCCQVHRPCGILSQVGFPVERGADVAWRGLASWSATFLEISASAAQDSWKENRRVARSACQGSPGTLDEWDQTLHLGVFGLFPSMRCRAVLCHFGHFAALVLGMWFYFTEEGERTAVFLQVLVFLCGCSQRAGLVPTLRRVGMGSAGVFGTE